MLRLVAGHNDRSRRPIAITEVHVPSMTSLTVVPTDENVMEAWERVCDIATEIRTAIATGKFPAQPGPWCRYCGHVDICPAQQAPI
jgi:CRISPR/Cas system-associated exonuclease Cas4 (RecB family)